MDRLGYRLILELPSPLKQKKISCLGVRVSWSGSPGTGIEKARLRTMVMVRSSLTGKQSKQAHYGVGLPI